jgi:NAD(P)-dependent dehydrogenase (short-subunit alcohol dehydrogenase family)
MSDRFSLSRRVVAISGGGGLLGCEHAKAVVEAGGTPVLLDLDIEAAERAAAEAGGGAWALRADVTDETSLEAARDAIAAREGRLDALVNNAARNPKVEGDGLAAATRLERMPLAEWRADLEVGLTGAFLCSRVLGSTIASSGHGGAIVNIASDLALISPDQRLYRVDGASEDEQPVKPISYSVVKAGLVGLTRWLATYWADAGVRVNAISPGGVEAGQPEEFVARLSDRIPLGRMARQDEYRAAIVFLLSDASSYMTGHNLVMDGGRTVW